MPPTPKTEESIFAEALEKGAPEARAAYLDDACGNDAALRSRVESLLESHDQAGSFLRQPPAPTVDEPALERPGTFLGPYKLLQQIGEGGMGVVYMAEQVEPVRRKVALKIIKPGMDSAQVIARFESERQALAMMDHQNIAKVLEAGTSATGRPYFVMELVHGVPITQFCDENQLTPRERLELFIPVCQAIQHAHQKGVIHRDVKPSNVLVTMYDDRPVPKVIDFGVAKAIDQRLTEKSLFTQFGTMVGTFEYMSPEQAEMNAFGVDTRSDIYSLGVLLYELLTGTTPIERRRLREAAYGEIVRLIKEEEPPRPSVRIGTSGDRLPALSRQRGTDPGKLSRLVRGELDWIVLRCLEKDRTRRYETASGLARDVERYLKDEAVEACPPSAGYRLRKFLRKHRAGVLTAAALVAVLVLGVVVSTWQAVRATNAERVARFEQVRAQAAEDEARASEEKARDQTRLAERKAAEALAFVTFIRSLARPVAERYQEAVEGVSRHDLSFLEALDAAEPEIAARFANSPLAEAEVRALLGDLHFAVGDEKAVRQYELVVKLRCDALGPDAELTLSSMLDLAWALSYGTKEDRAVSLYEEVVAIRRAKLGPLHPKTLKPLIDMAQVLSESKDEKKRARADLLFKTAEQVVADRKAQAPKDLDTLILATYLGLTYAQWIGRPEDARRLLEPAEQAYWLYHDRPKLDDPAVVSFLFRLAGAYTHAEKFDPALRLYERYYQALRAGVRLGEGERSEFWRFMDNGIAHVWEPYPYPSALVEKCDEVAGVRDRYAAVLAEHLALLRQRAPADERSLEKVLLHLGRCRMRQGRWAEAESLLRQSVALREKRQPNHWTTYYVKSLLGGTLSGQKRHAEAERLLVESHEAIGKDESAPPAQVIEEMERLVQLYDDWGKKDEAARWRKAIEERKAAEAAKAAKKP